MTANQPATTAALPVDREFSHLIPRRLRRYPWMLAFGLAFWLSLSLQPALIGASYREDRILIQPKGATTMSSLDSFQRSRGGRRLRHFQRLSGIQVIEVPPGTKANHLIEAYQRSGLVDAVEPDFFVEPTAAPSDPNFQNGALWYLNQRDLQGNRVGPDIQAALAWDTKTNADDMVVALIDTGARLTHEDLSANLWTNSKEIPNNGIDDDGNGFIDDVHGIDAANQTGNPTDLIGHGSRVAGVIGGVGDNGHGGVGVAWKIKMMICRYSNNSGQGSFSDILECFDYARANGARIINASFGSTNTSSLLLTALNACRSAGIIVVAGAGNSGINNDLTPFYPASYALDNIVSVAATTSHDELASYSNFGLKSVDLAAPGTDILSTGSDSDTQYLYDSGTSYSTAITSGALALLWARFPAENYAQIIQRLSSSVDIVPGLSNKCVTGGRLNLSRALGPSLLADFSFAPSSTTNPLTLNLKDNSFGTIAQRQWIFGDGTTATESAPTHSFPYFGTYPVRLSVSNPAGTSSSVEKEVVVSPAYSISPATYTWLTPSSPTALSLPNDGVSAARTIPFPFNYYGTTRTQIYVGANGLAGFTAAGLSKAANTDLPDSTEPNDFLSPFWSDLVPSASTTISVGTMGAAPNRRLVVTWSRISLPAPRTATVNFQVILLESSNEILFNYQEVAATSGNTNSAGKRATIGVEGPSGTAATRFSYLGSIPLTNNQAIRWTPPASWPRPGVIQSIPSTSLVSSGSQGGPFQPTTQLLRLTNAGGTTLRWQAESTVDWVELSTTSGTLLPDRLTPLAITLTPQAASLPPGSYRGEIRFNGGALVTVYELNVYGIIRLLPVLPVIGGIFSLQAQGDPVTRYILEGTTDLLNWFPVSTNQTDPSGILSFSQPITAEFPFRFFRATRLDSTPAF